MLHKILNYKKKVLLSVGALFLCSNHWISPMIGVSALPAVEQAQTETVAGWKQFHSVPGSCSISFPETPEHVKQVLPLPEEEQDLRYDVYVSAYQKEAVYMVLVAQYPTAVDDSYAELSLESFLNGILTQNSDNRLIFADLVDVQGHKGLDFFIQTGNVYFKGRAVMADHNLYLLAMECEIKNYRENHFNHFINSFMIEHN